MARALGDLSLPCLAFFISALLSGYVSGEARRPHVAGGLWPSVLQALCLRPCKASGKTWVVTPGDRLRQIALWFAEVGPRVTPDM